MKNLSRFVIFNKNIKSIDCKFCFCFIACVWRFLRSKLRRAHTICFFSDFNWRRADAVASCTRVEHQLKRPRNNTKWKLKKRTPFVNFRTLFNVIRMRKPFKRPMMFKILMNFEVRLITQNSSAQTRQLDMRTSLAENNCNLKEFI